MIDLRYKIFTLLILCITKTYGQSYCCYGGNAQLIGNTQSIQSKVQLHLAGELIEWVIENICKNGLDAMEGSGTITASIHDTEQEVQQRCCQLVVGPQCGSHNSSAMGPTDSRSYLPLRSIKSTLQE